MSKTKVAGTLILIIGYLFVFAFADKLEAGTSIGAVPTAAVPTEDDGLPTVILDAGHGGADGGCISYNGVPEKGINLAIMLDLKAMLQAYGYNVIVTRDGDFSIHDKDVSGLSNQKKSDMKNRLDIFNYEGDAIAISIHQNQFTDGRYSGAQMFYSDTNPESEKLALALQETFVENLQPENKREIKLSGKELYLIYFAENPSVMIECGFLSNPDEANLLQSEEYQKKVAFTIFKGINEYCGAA